MRKRWPETLLAVYWITLLTGTHWPRLHLPEVPGKDKTLHVLAYAALAALVLNVAVRRPAGWSRAAIAVGTIGLIGICGALDEWTQPYFGRSCELLDWIADISGAVAMSAGYLIVKHMRTD
jgi:VanZ family protein